MRILCPISPGELIDKITILQLKARYISSPEQQDFISTELQLLQKELEEKVPPSAQLTVLTAELQLANQALWDIEDQIRIKESKKDFSDEFIDLARSVYRKNDERAQVKRNIDELLGSDIREQKSYADYQ